MSSTMGSSQAERHRSLSVVALCILCGTYGTAWPADAAGADSPRELSTSAPTAAVKATAARASGRQAPPSKTTSAATTSPSPDKPPTAADVQAAQLCRDVHFMAYSTIEPGGQRVEESVTWDDHSKSYLIRGPILGAMLNFPGVSSIPSDAVTPQTLFRIAVRADYSDPIERFCEYNFQEKADCDSQGDITYTQTFTDCDLQTLQHVVMITPDQAGSVALIDIRFQDVRGVFSNPLDLSEGTDLRLRMR